MENFEKPPKTSKTSTKLFIEEKGEKGKSKFSMRKFYPAECYKAKIERAFAIEMEVWYLFVHLLFLAYCEHIIK